MPQSTPSPQPAPQTPLTSAASSTRAPKVSFSFSGANSKKLPLAASSALSQRTANDSQHSAAAQSASVLISDGSASFQSLSAIASASSSPSTVPLVIPLKQATSWREKQLNTSAAAANKASSPAASHLTDTAEGEQAATATVTPAAAAPLTLHQQAEQQLLASANQPNYNSTTATLPSELYTTLSIPLKQPTAVQPVDTALQSAAVSVVDEPRYVIPLEEFGVALLRGMGWKGPGDAVGGANKADVQPVLMRRREERMGLGADTAANQLLPHQRSAKETDGGKAVVAAAKDNTAALSRPQSAAAALRAKLGARVLALASQQLRVDALVYIASGRHRRQYGRVREMVQRTMRQEQKEEDRMYKLEVKLNSGERVSVDSEDVDVLDERALPDDHPAFGKVKIEEEEARRSGQLDERREKESSSRYNRRDESDDRPDKRHKSTHDRASSSSLPPSSSRSSPPPPPPPPRSTSPSRPHSTGRPVWCAPQLRVRIVSRSLSSGSYFRCKARVVDVPAASAIELSLDDGRTVTVSEQQVETVIPSGKGGLVQIVRGELRGQVGELIERDSRRGVAVVQLEDDLQLHTLDFDDICERVR